MRRHQEVVEPAAAHCREAEAEVAVVLPALLLVGHHHNLLVLHHKAPDPLQCNFHGVIVHVGNANPKPPGLGAVERHARRDVELDLVDDHPPQGHLRLEALLLQQPVQVHPHEQPCVALQAGNPNLREPSRERAVPRGQPPRALGQEPPHERSVGQHRRDEALRLRGHQPEARHPARAAHHVVVVGVDDADPEPGEPEVFREAVHDVDEVQVALHAVLGDDLGDADEAGLPEHRGGVDLVADEVDVGVVDEGDD